jgi:hypothetical protein
MRTLTLIHIIDDVCRELKEYDARQVTEELMDKRKVCGMRHASARFEVTFNKVYHVLAAHRNKHKIIWCGRRVRRPFRLTRYKWVGDKDEPTDEGTEGLAGEGIPGDVNGHTHDRAEDQ